MLAHVLPRPSPITPPTPALIVQPNAPSALPSLLAPIVRLAIYFSATSATPHAPTTPSISMAPAKPALPLATPAPSHLRIAPHACKLQAVLYI
jgi:hypothetical protein